MGASELEGCSKLRVFKYICLIYVLPCDFVLISDFNIKKYWKA